MHGMYDFNLRRAQTTGLSGRFNPESPLPTIGAEICSGTLTGTDACSRLSGNVCDYQIRLKPPKLVADFVSAAPFYIRHARYLHPPMRLCFRPRWSVCLPDMLAG